MKLWQYLHGLHTLYFMHAINISCMQQYSCNNFGMTISQLWYLQGVVTHATTSAMLEQLRTQDVHENLTDLKQAVMTTYGLLAKFSLQSENIIGLVSSTLKVVGHSFESEEKIGMCSNVFLVKLNQ